MFRSSSCSLPLNPTARLNDGAPTQDILAVTPGLWLPFPTRRMPTQISPPPLSVDQSKYLAIVKPYPLKANLNNYPDQRTLVLWLACCAGKEVLRALFYRPSVSPSNLFFLFHQAHTQPTYLTKFPETVVIEVNHQFDRFHDLLGQHVWSEFLMYPSKEEMGKSSTVLQSSFDTGRLFRGGSFFIPLLSFLTHVL